MCVFGGEGVAECFVNHLVEAQNGAGRFKPSQLSHCPFPRSKKLCLDVKLWSQLRGVLSVGQ